MKLKKTEDKEANVAQNRPAASFFSAKGKIGAVPISLMLQAMREHNRPDEQAGWDSFASAQSIAGKTGASYGFKDAWAIGITADHVVGVWMGNADGEGRPELTGVKAAAPLMFRILEGLPKDKSFPKSYAPKSIKVCSQSSFKAGPHCDNPQIKSLPEASEKAKPCPYHHLLHLNKEGTYLVNSSCYPVSWIKQKTWFILPAAEAWYFKQYNSHYVEPPEFSHLCSDHLDATKEVMELIYPRQFTRIYIPTELDGSAGSAVFEVAHRNPNASVYWHLDESYIGKTTGRHQLGLQPAKGKHTLFLLDEQGRELKLPFEVISERKAGKSL